MVHVTLTYPDELADALGRDRAGQGDYLRLMAALKLFEIGELSFRLAANLAGLSYDAFLAVCATYHVSLYNYRPDEMTEQLDSDAAALDRHEAFVARVQASLAEIDAGNVRRFATTAELMAAIDSADDEE